MDGSQGMKFGMVPDKADSMQRAPDALFERDAELIGVLAEQLRGMHFGVLGKSKRAFHSEAKRLHLPFER
jgi:hypothetical protein